MDLGRGRGFNRRSTLSTNAQGKASRVNVPRVVRHATNPLPTQAARIDTRSPRPELGKRTIHYLLHAIGAEGIRATLKIVKDIQDLPFPSTLKDVQSFLGSLNCYHKFIKISQMSSLGQEHDGIIQPGRFTGSVLNDAQLRNHIAEKEVLAVIRVLHVFKT
ncbi:reverse transcriptase [Phytophthora palmivora]|uniref:Reverse transcriptase n=1 Tax=Phytophthora palmivora TaxID=4796 RepID=A0A2P4X4V0_9STRA|nr:reverse transcriptase [Phytophthora palmivora]